MVIDASENHTHIVTSDQTEKCTHKLWKHSTPQLRVFNGNVFQFISVLHLFQFELFTRINNLATFSRHRIWLIRFDD